MKHRVAVALTLLITGTTLIGCGDDGSPSSAPSPDEGNGATSQEAPTRVNIAALDYSFEAPETITGGVVEFAFTNRGKEPHFFGLAKIPEGGSFEQVKAALTAPPPTAAGPGAPPAGPPPFEDFAGIATSDPGVGGQVSFNLPAGDFVFYCLIPSPDGVSHAVKGMIKELEVSEGEEGTVAETDSELSFTGTDFAFDKDLEAQAGDNVFKLRNEGNQLHEVNLIEVSEGKTMDDVIAWHRQMSGPPPLRFLGGVAIKPGEDATTTLELEGGKSYAFICAIPDVLGDFAPHVTKGMHTKAVTVS